MLILNSAIPFFLKSTKHYENLPVQYTENFSAEKIENFIDIFNIYAKNIDCRYTLESPRRGGSNKYPQSIFWSKNKKNRYTPAYGTPVLLYKSGVQGGIQHYIDMFS